MDELLRVEDLTVALPTRSGYAKAVDGMSFAVDTGEVMGIAGESGSGKTITALSLFGLLPAGARVTGSIRLDGIELTALSGKQLRAVRGRQIAMVSQDPATSLHPILPIGTQLTEHMRYHLGVSKDEALIRAAVRDVRRAAGRGRPDHGPAGAAAAPVHPWAAGRAAAGRRRVTGADRRQPAVARPGAGRLPVPPALHIRPPVVRDRQAGSRT